ncbi:LUD domain-containing protein [Flavobacterium sp. I3-2]|uniref:LUD domain-containing protein n=1 Tax=Flavobacterium sp. I3-2 TaxID=2748319 RepID=UPI0015AB54D9|nr:LUD domain-containing protein [Flavobacterium sp. I3-2]
MNFFKKILGNIVPSMKEENSSDKNESKYLPEPEIPVDELFTFNFKNNGGKFIYCENELELQEYFISILQENDWFEKEAITFEKKLHPFLIENRIIFHNVVDPVFFLCSCESLIADDGSILFSSHQLLHHKSNELPKDIIVIAKTSQITRSKSDGLRGIKYRYSSNIPSNITTLQNFKEVINDNFLQYGIAPKNLYLLLLEDL